MGTITLTSKGRPGGKDKILHYRTLTHYRHWIDAGEGYKKQFKGLGDGGKTLTRREAMSSEKERRESSCPKGNRMHGKLTVVE